MSQPNPPFKGEGQYVAICDWRDIEEGIVAYGYSQGRPVEVVIPQQFAEDLKDAIRESRSRGGPWATTPYTQVHAFVHPLQIVTHFVNPN